jgi:hypothetical protein
MYTLIKTSVTGMKNLKSKLWDPVMDVNHNPLMSIPLMQRYQIMIVLGSMWSFVFCAMIGWWMLFPYWVVGHIALLTVASFATNWTFSTSARAPSHRDLYRSKDGLHARHDDIWGG